MSCRNCYHINRLLPNNCRALVKYILYIYISYNVCSKHIEAKLNSMRGRLLCCMAKSTHNTCLFPRLNFIALYNSHQGHELATRKGRK